MRALAAMRIAQERPHPRRRPDAAWRTTGAVSHMPKQSHNVPALSAVALYEELSVAGAPLTLSVVMGLVRPYYDHMQLGLGHAVRRSGVFGRAWDSF